MKSVLSQQEPETASRALVSATDVTRRYGDDVCAALRGVSLDVAEGELTARMGPSGAGASTRGQGGEAELTERFYEAAREPMKRLVPGAGPSGGIEAQPEDYERRVAGFFDDAHLRDGGREP